MIHRGLAPLPRGSLTFPAWGSLPSLGWPSLDRPRPSETFLAELGEGHYRGQLWGGQELLELLQLLLLLLQEVSLLLGEAEAGGQNTDHGKRQGNTPPCPPKFPLSLRPRWREKQTELREDGGRRHMRWENFPRGKTSARAQGINKRLLSLKSYHPEGSHVYI